MVRRRLAWAGLAIALALGLGLVIVLFQSAPDSAPPGDRALSARVQPRAHVRRAAELPGPGVVIDEIRVEKPVVCAGEDNLITVRAHTSDPEDAADLVVSIDGQLGREVALRRAAFLGRDGEPPHVVAMLDTTRRVTADVPPFEVRTCPPRAILVVQHRPVPNQPDQLELWAHVVAPPDADGFHPVRYRWHFGDGGDDTVTDGPILDRSFRDRPQHAITSHVLVTCTAESESGGMLVGRDNLELLNRAYEIFSRRGVVALEFNHPQYPELDDRGVVSWPVRVWHHHTSAVTITELHRIRVDGDDDQRDERVDVASVLGTDRIPASGVSFTVRLDTRAEPNARYALYRFSGHTDDGYPAGGDFSVMRPTEAPTRDHHDVRIQDPQLIAKILAAQHILGRSSVTDEDIWTLEREGKLADATVDPAQLPPRLSEDDPGPKGAGARQP